MGMGMGMEGQWEWAGQAKHIFPNSSASCSQFNAGTGPMTLHPTAVWIPHWEPSKIKREKQGLLCPGTGARKESSCPWECSEIPEMNPTQLWDPATPSSTPSETGLPDTSSGDSPGTVMKLQTWEMKDKFNYLLLILGENNTFIICLYCRETLSRVWQQFSIYDIKAKSLYLNSSECCQVNNALFI